MRVLFDGLGSIGASGEQSGTLPAAHRQPLSIENYLTSQSNVDVRKSKNPWLTGDHVKTMVIDGKLAYLGGMNIGREYRYDWHDLMVEIQGPVVDRINREFQIAWGRAGMLGGFQLPVQLAGTAAQSRPGRLPGQAALYQARPG